MVVAEYGLRLTLASSAALLAELHCVLLRSKFERQLAKRELTSATLYDGYAALVGHVTPATAPRVITRDPADDHVLACALEAHANASVSGDRHLLDLQPAFRGIAILTAAQAVERIGSQG